jgi:hypothetical protein
MREELCANPFVLRQHEVGTAQCLRRPVAEIAEIPDGCGHDIKAGRKPLCAHRGSAWHLMRAARNKGLICNNKSPTSNDLQKESWFRHIRLLGEGS